MFTWHVGFLDLPFLPKITFVIQLYQLMIKLPLSSVQLIHGYGRDMCNHVNILISSARPQLGMLYCLHKSYGK